MRRETGMQPRLTIDRLGDGDRLRAARFIVTVYGDVVEPRGGVLWMGTLIEVCALAGISETRVRTAVSRLVAAGRLEGTRDGRRSFYRLTPGAGAEFAAAAARIFAPPRPPATWVLAVPSGPDGEAALLASGFASVGPLLYLGPDLGNLPPNGVVFRAAWLEGRDNLRRLAAELWHLPDLAAAYEGFLERHAPLATALADGMRLPPQAAFMARLFLVDDFRGVVLADPCLPAEALPEGWPEARARALFAELYLQLSPDADSYIAGFANRTGALPAETAATRRRIENVRAMTGS